MAINASDTTSSASWIESELNRDATQLLVAAAVGGKVDKRLGKACPQRSATATPTSSVSPLIRHPELVS